MLLLILTLCSAGAFFYYGYEALVADRVRQEFERYGVPQYRVLVGSLQVMGALGALVGLVNDTIGALATGGLMLMMLIGVAVRLRIHGASGDGAGGILRCTQRSTSVPPPDLTATVTRGAGAPALRPRCRPR